MALKSITITTSKALLAGGEERATALVGWSLSAAAESVVKFFDGKDNTGTLIAVETIPAKNSKTITVARGLAKGNVYVEASSALEGEVVIQFGDALASYYPNEASGEGTKTTTRTKLLTNPKDKSLFEAISAFGGSGELKEARNT